MSQMDMATSDWKMLLRQRLPLLGHRNWIGVVDAAYPWQTALGVEMVATGSEHIHVLTEVRKAVQLAPHVRSKVQLDAEMSALSDKAAPGIGLLREKMNQILQNDEIAMVPHEEIISRLDVAARLFRVLLFKTTLTLPYTSVLIELDCGYWSVEREQALRLALSKSS